MSEYEIEKNVPIKSEWATSKAKWIKYPFGKMQIGDSFLCGPEDEKKVGTASYQFGKKHNMKFMSRKEGEGRRVWRIA